MTVTVSRGDRLKVFVSYSRANVDWADQIVAMLEQRGYDAILDRHDIVPGEPWEQRLGNLLFECDKVVFILTETSAASTVCQWEVEEAARLGKPMIPVTIAPLANVEPPPQLAALNYIYFYTDPNKPGSGPFAGAGELDGWLKTDLDWTRERTRLAARARQHQQNPVDALLMRGEELAGAQSWSASQPEGSSIPDELTAYIAASTAAEVALKAEADAQIAEREEALARAEAAVATEQLALSRAEKAQRGQRYAVGLGLVAALVLASLGGLAAWYATDRALSAQTLRSDLFAAEAAEFANAGEYVPAILMALIGDPAAQTGAIESRLRSENITSRAMLEHAMIHTPLIQEWQPGSRVNDLAAHPTDPDMFATAHQDKMVRLWRRGEFEPVQVFEGHALAVESVEFHPDGERLLTGSHDRTARLWKIGQNEPLQVFGISAAERFPVDYIGHTQAVNAAVFHPDGEHVVTGGSYRAVLWQIGRENAVREFPGQSVFSIAIDRATGDIFLGSFQGTLSRWKLDGEAPVASREVHPGHNITSITPVNSGSYSYVLTSSSDGTASKWSADLGGRRHRHRDGTGNAIRSLDMHPDGARIVTAEHDGSVSFWNWHDMSRPAYYSPPWNLGSASAAVFTVDGDHVIEAHRRGAIRMWSLPASTSDGQTLTDIYERPSGYGFWETASEGSERETWPVASMRDRLFPRGDRILRANDVDIEVWSLGAKVPDEVLKADFARAGVFAVHPDGTQFLAARKYDSEQIGLWQLGQAEPIRTYQISENGIFQMAFLPSGDSFIVSTGSGAVRRWDIDQDAPVETIIEGDPNGRRREEITFRIDTSGKHLLTTNGTKAELRSLSSGELMQTFPHHANVSSFDFHPSGVFVATGSTDAYIWRVGSAQPVQTFTNIKDSNWGVDIRFTKDGERVLLATSMGATLSTLHPMLLKETSDAQVTAACSYLAGAVVQPWFDDGHRQALPALRALTDAELDPCGLRPKAEDDLAPPAEDAP
ncbi:MAG: TIR domain-containing protein [Pseudomonadota bacterium]